MSTPRDDLAKMCDGLHGHFDFIMQHATTLPEEHRVKARQMLRELDELIHVLKYETEEPTTRQYKHFSRLARTCRKIYARLPDDAFE